MLAHYAEPKPFNAHSSWDSQAAEQCSSNCNNCKQKTEGIEDEKKIN